MSEASTARFRLGRILSTPQALALLTPEDICLALLRHQSGDWGDVDDHDRQANEDALLTGARLLSVHHSRQGWKFWIITEADRRATTVLLPEDD